ncbi:alanine:cation symporter family protein, partial [Campylobacter coli]
GNIAGISIAIAAGGAGALFWMWFMAFFGGASAFAESTLAQIYLVKYNNEKQRYELKSTFCEF